MCPGHWPISHRNGLPAPTRRRRPTSGPSASCSGRPSRARAGLAFALAVPVLPLGNFALGAAILYGAAALGLFALAWREPPSGLLFSLGPLLAPISCIGLLPLAALAVRSPVRRAVQIAAA